MITTTLSSNRTLMIILLVLTLFACKKNWFDAKSDKSLAVPSTLEDFQQLMDNYQLFNELSPGLGEVASDGKYTNERIWESLFANPTASMQQWQVNAFTWSQKYIIQDLREWTNAYHRILNCNIIIEGLSKLSNYSNSEKNTLKGSALFYRSKSIFDLSQIFAEPYDPLIDSNYGLQLKTNSDVTEKCPRSTVHQTYEFLISNLKEATKLLPLQASKPTRPSKLSCWALLSRIYLVMGEFSNSKAYADTVISKAPGLLDFHMLAQTTIIFPLFNKEVLYQSTSEEYPLTYAPTVCHVDRELYNSFSENDARKTIFFRVRTDGNIRFNGSYSNEVSILPFSGIGLDEIYLNRAESYMQLNNISAAMNDMQTLLIQRYHRREDGSTLYESPKILNKKEGLMFIYQERYKELMFRGIRWMDLRRKSIDMTFKKTKTRIIGGQTYSLEPGSYKFTLPLPENEITLSEIPQNPGWK